MMKWVVIGLALIMRTVTATAAEPALFPFVLPWDDAAESVANVSAWSPPVREPVRVGADGHFYVGKQRIRFWGVNICFGACFPKREDAEKIAARLAKFGINVVRFHHLDMFAYPSGIRARGRKDTRELDAEALDRLDYFIAQLKQHGIYANLNLLVSRPFNAADGLPAAVEQLDWKRRAVVGFFDTSQWELQQEYARQLLTHRNPFTKLTYAEDPAVAFVEINNENGLIHAWLGNELDGLPPVFAGNLQRQWNAWLQRRYGTTAKLRTAWQVQAEPVGAELLAADSRRWVLERHEGAAATLRVADATTQITVTQPGRAAWHVQYHQPGLNVTNGRAYTVSFRAKADRAAEINVNLGQANQPWSGLGFSAPVRLTPEWQTFRFTFVATATEANARLCFSNLARQTGDYGLADVSLRPGGVVGLGAEEMIEAGAVGLFPRGQWGERTPPSQRDWLRFLWETEDRYWQTMNRFLKNDLKVRGVVLGTIVGCSTPNLMAKFDAVDAHAYWQHPQFPGQPWDQGNWFVPNKTMVNEAGGVLPSLAMKRVRGKPHCVTEYGHPAPNTYSSEGFLLLAAYGALQDWDAIYAFAYSHRHDDWDTRRLTSFFDIDQHPAKMATLIPAAAMFRRGDVQRARQEITATLSRERELDLLGAARAWSLVDAGSLGIAKETALRHRVAMDLSGSGVPPGRSDNAGVAIPSDTGELLWDTTVPGRGVVTVNAPRSKAVIGFGGGKRFALGEFIIEPGPTRQDGWSAITVTERQPGRWLVTATGYVENTGMPWKNAEKTTVGREWGKAPSLVEGVPAKITMVSRKPVAGWVLDERGQRTTRLRTRVEAAGGYSFDIGPEHKSLWYEVAAE